MSQTSSVTRPGRLVALPPQTTSGDPGSPARPIGESPTIARPLRALVLSKHELVRAGLTQLLSSDARRVSVVERLTQAGDLRSLDVVVFDLSGHLGALPRELPVLLAKRVPVLVLTAHERSYLTESVLALGVAGTVHLNLTAEELIRAVELAAAGQSAAQVASRHQRREAARAGTQLTERELSILELVGTGLNNQDIADRLHLSINTVKTYIRSAYRKIRVSRRAEAVLWVVHHRLDPPFAGQTRACTAEPPPAV